MASTNYRPAQVTIKPSMSWLIVFVPALSYFVATRLSSSGFRWGRSNSLGDTVTSSVQLMGSSSSSSSSTSSSISCATLSKDIFYTSQSCDDVTVRAEQRISLQNTMNLLAQGRGMSDIVDSTWRHDEELGRGYLLFSQSSGNGRIWRWEVGGGPIAIGRSLHLESSGCRSGGYHPCVVVESDAGGNNNNGNMKIRNNNKVGSGGLSIDFHHGSESDKYSEGSLVMAEWGEGRIVRMEEVNGARTPLMIQIPDLCSGGDGNSGGGGGHWKRLHQPRSLLYTPYGDLLVADTAPECQKSGIFRLSQAVHVPALESLAQSREAHTWNKTEHSFLVDTFYHQNVQQIGGMSMDPTWLNLVATVSDEKGQVLLVQIPLTMEEDEEENDTTEAEKDDGSEDDEDKIDREKEEAQSTTEDSAGPAASVTKGVMDDKVTVLMDLTEKLGISESGPLVVDEKGHIFVAIKDGIAVLSSCITEDLVVLGVLNLPQKPTSLTLGEDNFLYSFADDSVFRIRLRVGPVAIPTNLVVGKK